MIYRFKDHLDFVGTLRPSQRTDTDFFTHELILADGRAIGCRMDELEEVPQ